MNQQIEKLKGDLRDDLDELSDMPEGIEKLIRSLQIIDLAISNLYQLAKASKFNDEQEEIRFFKHLEPEILACRIEEVMRYNLSVNLPIGTVENKIKYYEDELRARRSFFRMNSFHYQYFKNRLSDLDSVFFLRSTARLTIPVAELTEADNEFSTPMTYLFAKFIAYEHIQYYILEQIAILKYPDHQHPRPSGQTNELKWTGDAVNIVELAYGIWLTGQLNNGNASLNQIVRWLETTLQVTIGIIQRRFTEIERRKRLSPTNFIDKMKEAIMKKINNGNA
jgi:hypothetical protein